MKPQLPSKYPWKSSREPLGVRETQVEKQCSKTSKLTLQKFWHVLLRQFCQQLSESYPQSFLQNILLKCKNHLDLSVL